MPSFARRLVPLAVVIAALAALVLPTSAGSAPIDDKKAQAAQLETQITENGRKLSALNEQINDAQIELDAANATITAADAAVAVAQVKTTELRTAVAERAVSVYMRSGSEGGVAELDATNANELATRQKYTSVAAQRDNQLVFQLKRAQEELAVRKNDAEQARGAAEVQKQLIESARVELDASDQKQRELLSSVKGEIAELVRQAEEARRAREAAEAAARLRLAATPAVASTPTAAASNATAGNGGNAGGGGGGARAVSAPSPSGGVGGVLSYAYAQVGKPYCHAGAGPGCFDCSGLTMMAWAQAGVSMPHGSNAQLGMFPRVPMNALQSGDLVFWSGHVGIYVGGGQVLHAPHTGDVVKVAPIWGGVIGANRPG